MPDSLDSIARLAPAVWPGVQLSAQPGDLNLFMPQGMGLAGPFPILPYSNPEISPGDYYSFETPSAHPLRNAPLSLPEGGVLYFDDGQELPDLQALFRLLRIHDLQKNYAVFVEHAEKPQEQRFLTQIRIVPRSTLEYVYHIPFTPETEPLVQQPLSIGEFIPAFLEQQQKVWGRGMSSELRGLFGGDGDWAKESLCFGFWIENADHAVYRLWSRAWLVTK